MPIIKRELKKRLENTTQTALASELDVSQGTIGKYLCSNPEPKTSTLLKFSKGLGIPLDVLLGKKPSGVAESLGPYELDAELIPLFHTIPETRQAEFIGAYRHLVMSFGGSFKGTAIVAKPLSPRRGATLRRAKGG